MSDHWQWQGDEVSGCGFVQLSANNAYEKYDVIATVAPDSQVIATEKKYIAVCNCSRYHPVMVSYDAVGNGGTNEIRLEPGAHHVFLRAGIKTVYFYAVVATARIVIIASDMNPVSMIPSINKEHNFRLDRMPGTLSPKAIKNGIYYTTDAYTVRKSVNRDGIWAFVHDFAPQQPDMIFVTQNNTLLVFTKELSLWRGANGGAGTWTEIKTGLTGLPFRGAGIDQSRATGTIIFTEYHTNPDTKDAHVYRSDDDGVTWTAVVTYTAPFTTIRHIHFIKCDYTEGNTWYYGTGDTDAETKICKSTDDGATFIDFVAAPGGTPPNYGPQQAYRCLGYLFTDSDIIWAMDAPNMKTRIFKAPKSDLSQKVQKASFDGPVYSVTQWEHCMFVLTKVETAYNQTRETKVYFSEDDGETWKILMKWPIKTGQTNAGFIYFTMSDEENGNCMYVITDWNEVGTGAPDYICSAVKVSLD